MGTRNEGLAAVNIPSRHQDLSLPEEEQCRVTCFSRVLNKMPLGPPVYKRHNNLSKCTFVFALHLPFELRSKYNIVYFRATDPHEQAHHQTALNSQILKHSYMFRLLPPVIFREYQNFTACKL